MELFLTDPIRTLPFDPSEMASIEQEGNSGNIASSPIIDEELAGDVNNSLSSLLMTGMEGRMLSSLLP